MFKVFSNKSPLLVRPRAKIFDPVEKKLVFEPYEIIDQRIDYRSMMIDAQIENGTLNKDADFSNYGVDALDMSDAVSSSMADLNNQLDEKELNEKEKEEFDKLIKSLDDNN